MFKQTIQLWFVATIALSSLSFLTKQTAFAADDKPSVQPANVVVILADDSGWGDYSLHGNTNIATPRIDALAKQGAAFDRFFVCAVCAPTRAEFLTGRYHPRGGVRGVSTGQERLNIGERTIADEFKRAGYKTAAFGKWHNGSQWPYHPNARGFDEYLGFTSGHWGEYFDPPLDHNGKLVREKGYVADIFTNHAIDFIEQHQDNPFFCYVAFNTPHSPWGVPQEYWQRFEKKPIAMRGKDGDKEELPTTRCALAMVENLDWNVGRLLDRLDELKLADNTIVVYFSDNGPNTWRWNGDMKGRKGSVDEGGVRSPLFIRYPQKIQPETHVKQIAGAIDLFPTIARLAGVAIEATKDPLDGQDLTPLLAGNTEAWPDRRIFSNQNGQVSVRTQQYRLDPRGALFDMQADPSQKHDVAKEHPQIAKDLTTAVARWKQEVLPKGPDDRPYPVGYEEFPVTPLPARDGIAHGGIQRSAPAPNCSYFVNWKKADDRISWDVDVHTAGDYKVVIYYTCPAKDAGSVVELSFQEAKLQGTVQPGWDPPLYTNQDTIERPKAESQMKEFHPLDFGQIHLPAGRGELQLKAVKIPGASVMDVRLVTLELLPAR